MGINLNNMKYQTISFLMAAAMAADSPTEEFTVYTKLEQAGTYAKEQYEDARDKAQDIVDNFLHEHGIDTFAEEEYSKAEKFSTDHKLRRKMACYGNMKSTTTKLSEYILLISTATPMSISAGIVGVGET